MNTYMTVTIIKSAEEYNEKLFNELECGHFFIYEGLLFQKVWCENFIIKDKKETPVLEEGLRIDTGEIIVFKGVETVIFLPGVKIIF